MFKTTRIVRWVLAGVLLVAAGLKMYPAVAESRIFFGHATQRWWELALVQWELFLGLWLLSGLWPRGSLLAALGCFGLFAVISLYKAVTGQTDCGCLGRVAVNPWYMASFDLLAVSLLCYCWPASKLTAAKDRAFTAAPPNGKTSTSRWAAWLLVWLALAVLVTYLMWPNVEAAPLEIPIGPARELGAGEP